MSSKSMLIEKLQYNKGSIDTAIDFLNKMPEDFPIPETVVAFGKVYISWPHLSNLEIAVNANGEISYYFDDELKAKVFVVKYIEPEWFAHHIKENANV